MTETETKSKLQTNAKSRSYIASEIDKTVLNYKTNLGFNDSNYNYVIEAESDDKTFLNIVMRTQGKRIFPMEQALTCLCAQLNQNFSLTICIHSDSEDKEAIENVLTLVRSFSKKFQSKISILSVIGGKRGVPMNIGIELSNADYVAFLDDDDLVTSEWVGTFHDLAKDNYSSIIRNRCVDRIIEKRDSNAYTPQITKSNWLVTRSDNFRFIESLERNSSPLHSYAIPIQTIKEYGTYVNASYDVAEDWDFLMRNAALTGVINSPLTNSIYNRWDNSDSSLHLHDANTWRDIHNEVIENLTSNSVMISSIELKELTNLLSTMYHLKDLVVELKNSNGFGAIKEQLNELDRFKTYFDILNERPKEVHFGLSIKRDSKNLIKRIFNKVFKKLGVRK